MTTHVREDRTRLDAFERFVKQKHEIRVGILDKGNATHEDDGFTIAYLASIHEFGLGQIERSFIRGWYDARNLDLGKIAIEHYRNAIVASVDPATVLGQLAAKFAADCQARMVSGWSYPDISQETKDRKESSTPLIDTGVLKASITGMVVTQ
jgi:hypothetical protein